MKLFFLFFFVAFCSAQELQVKGGTYTSTADTLSITDIGFTPEFVLVKLNTTTYPVWRCSSHLADSSALNASADIRGGIISLDVDGFTLGLNGSVQTGTTVGAYVAIAGVKIATGNYTGTGGNVAVNLGWQAGMVIAKANMVAHHTAIKLANQSGSTGFTFVDAEATNFFTLTSTGFTANAVLSASGRKYTYIAIEDNPLFYGDTLFTGNGTDNRDFATIFNGEVLFIKRQNSGTAGVWKVDETVGEPTYRLDNFGHIATNAIQSFSSSAFQLGTSTNVNFNTGTYAAWYLRSYSIPQMDMSTGKFKGNSTYSQFKGW